MTNAGDNVDLKPLRLPDLNRERKSDADFMDDLVEGGNELRTAIVESVTLLPRTEMEPTSLAVLMGLMVRLYKLFDTFLCLICECRMDMAMIVARCAYDTSIDILYFCHTRDEADIADFIDTTLASSKVSYDFVEEDRKAGRGDPVVRERIKSSIESDFRKAGRELDDIDSSKWSRKKSVRKRAEELGLGIMHPLLFQNLSGLVHGSWSELVKHHLTETGASWRPNLAFACPRPEIMSSFPILIAEAAMSYADYVAMSQLMVGRLQKIADWFQSMSDLHEAFLRTD